MHHIRTKPGQPIHRKYMMELLGAGLALFNKMVKTSVFDMEVPSHTDGKLVICGDTHGQLADFLWVLKQNGEPSPTNAYLLNGDIADRGENAVEILVRPAQRRSRARWGCVLTRRAWRGAARSSRSCTSCFTQRPFPSTAGTTRTSK